MDNKQILEQAMKNMEKKLKFKSITFSDFFFDFILPISDEVNYREMINEALNHPACKVEELGLVYHITLK